MVERVDIQVTDQVAGSVATKLKDIADNAERGGRAIDTLKKNLSGLNPSALSRLAQANNEAATAALKNQRAAEQSAKATLDQQRASVQLQQASVRLQQANNQLAVSEQKVAQQTANTAKAQTAAAQSALRLQQAQAKLQQQNTRSQQGGTGSAALVGVGAGAATKVIFDQIDAYQLLENKLRSVTSSEEERIKVQNELVQIANRTFQTTDATATLYQRLSSATKRLGLDQKELFTVIENVGKAFALSGATAEEAQGAIIQLTQAIGGDFKSSSQELNTILEQAPILADVFAKQLGVTRTELKGLAKDGQLSAKDFVAAFSESGKGIQELNLRFGNLSLAISQAGTQFRNNFGQAVGKLAEATGAANGLVKGIQFLGDHMEVVLALGTTLFPLLVAGFARTALAAGALNIVLRANPLLLGASIIAGAVVGLTVLKDKSEAVKEVWDAMAPVVIRAIDAMTGGLASAGFDQWITNAVFGLAQLGDGIDTLTFGLTDFGGKLLKQAAEMQIRLNKGAADAKQSAADLKAGLEGVGDSAKSAGNELDDAGKKAHSVGNADFGGTVSGLQQSTTWASRLADELNRAGIAARSIGANVIQLGPASAIGGYGVAEPLHKPVNSITGKEWSSYATGGYTGDGGKYEPKGVVHGGEFVVNKEATSHHYELLNAINKNQLPGYANGGRVPEDGGYSITRANGRVDHFSPTGQLLRSDPATSRTNDYSFNSRRGSGGLDAWMNAPHIGGTVSLLSIGASGPTDEQKKQIEEWTTGLTDWWTQTKPTIKPAENIAILGSIVSDWLSDIPKAVADTNFKFDDVRQKLAANGWAASVLQGAPPWSDTLGKYVNYAGPSYGGSVTYGGAPREPVSYNLPTPVDPNATSAVKGLRMIYAMLDPNYHLPDWNNLFNLGNQAEGGSYTVPGSGGTDSKQVTMMATPGETIDVIPKGGRGGKSINVQMNISTPDANSFRKSRNQIIGELHRQLDAYQARN